jgi:deoxyribodipyrimidine photolyase-related protein
MGDYCKGCAYNPKKKHGEAACPFNSLYWNFYYRNAGKLKGNHRIGMMYAMLDKMDNGEVAKMNEQANVYLQNINTL